MFGKILRLDCKRQNRVDPSAFLSLFSPDSAEKIRELDNKVIPKQASLNSSLSGNPHEPALVRDSLYPFYFDATMIRTLFYNLKIHGDLSSMTRVFINKDQSVVFEFAESVSKETADRLQEVLNHLGHTEFTNPEISGKRVGFDIETASYTEPRGDENE